MADEMGVELRIGISWLALGALLLSACGGERPSAMEICTGVLERKVSHYEVVGTAPARQDRLEITYAVPAEGGAAIEGHLACEIESSLLGGLRLRAAVLDGLPLSDVELALVNSDLLFDELHWLGERRG